MRGNEPEEPGFRSLLTSFGDLIGGKALEWILTIGGCAISTALVVAIDVHPLISLALAALAIAGTIFVASRWAAHEGRPWRRDRYPYIAALLVAATAIAVFTVLQLGSECHCP